MTKRGVRERARIKRVMRPADFAADCLVVLGEGYVQYHKGVARVVDCASRLRQLRPDLTCRFVWIGKGYDLSRLFERHGKAPRIAESRLSARCRQCPWIAERSPPSRISRTCLIEMRGSLRSRLLSLTEPDPDYGIQLGERFRELSEVEVFQGTLEQYLVSAGARSVDAVVSSNVLEHVADDQGCLHAMFELLRPGGRLILYVPARPELYGPFDRRVGHNRRYRRGELRAKLRTAVFTVDRLQYRNLVGAIGWWYQNRFSGGAIESGVTLFDKVVFPITRRIEDLLPPPWV